MQRLIDSWEMLSTCLVRHAWLDVAVILSLLAMGTGLRMDIVNMSSELLGRRVMALFFMSMVLWLTRPLLVLNLGAYRITVLLLLVSFTFMTALLACFAPEMITVRILLALESLLGSAVLAAQEIRFALN